MHLNIKKMDTTPSVCVRVCACVGVWVCGETALIRAETIKVRDKETMKAVRVISADL